MKTNISIINILIITALLGLLGCSEGKVGSKSRPFAMYFIPSVDSEAIIQTANGLATYLSKSISQKLYGKDEGFYIKTAVPSNYIAVIEAFGTKKADFAAMTTFSYILARDIKKYDMMPIFTIIHPNGELTYKGQIITHKDSGIKTLADLNGKKFAFVDPASTSGYILPSKLFNESKIKLGQTVFAQKHDTVVTMVYQKQVDAGSTYYSGPSGTKINDARARVKTQFPDVEDKVRIIGFTHEVPNDPWVIRSEMFKDPEENAKVKKAIIDSIREYAESVDGKRILLEVYSILGLAPADEHHYDGIRKMILDAHINIEEVVNKKK